MIRAPRSFGAALTVAAFALLPLGVSAQLTPGTSLTGYMNAGLNSATAYAGETFSLGAVHSSNHDISGATAYGHVTQVVKAGQGRSAHLGIAFDKLYTRAGSMYRIAAYTTNVDVQTKSNATKEALSAAGGALLGGLIGGGVGAVVGGGGAFLFAKNNRENVSIPQGSTVTFQVTAVR